MALPDTLWFARKECKILALLVNKCKENSKRTGEEDAGTLSGIVRHSNLAKERQNHEKKLWVHRMVNRIAYTSLVLAFGGGERWKEVVKKVHHIKTQHVQLVQSSEAENISSHQKEARCR